MGFFDNQRFDQASNSIDWGNGQRTSLYNAPTSYTGGGGGQTTEDMDWASLINPALASLGYTHQGGQMMSGDGGVDAGTAQSQAQAAMDYLRNQYGNGALAIGSTRLSGSDSDGGQSRRDLFQQQADGTWRPIDNSGYLFGDAGTKSDGIKVGTILASFLTAGTLSGWGEGAGAAGGAGGGAGAGGAEATGATGATGSNGAFLGEGVPSGVEGWDAAYNGAGGTWSPGYGAEGVLDWSATNPTMSDGAFVGEGATSGVPEWDAAGGLGGTGAGVDGFNTNGLPNGSPYASDFAGAGGGAAAPGAAAGSGGGWGQYIPAATQALNALIAKQQADKARDALIAGGNQANATQRYMFDTLNALQAPYRETANLGLGNLNGLMRDPSSVTRDPGYEWQRQQGQQGIERSAAARGLGLSGAALKQASRYNTDYATTKYNDVWNRNLAAAGLGQVSNGQTNQFGTNYANNVGNTQMGMGNALAANYLNQGNIYRNALNSVGAYYAPRQEG